MAKSKKKKTIGKPKRNRKNQVKRLKQIMENHLILKELEKLRNSDVK